MPTLHRDLTGGELHEPKGADGAAANTVYVADGAGSGVWSAVPAASIANTPAAPVVATTVQTAINEVAQYTECAYGVFADISNPSTLLVPIPYDATILSIQFTLGGGITVANSTVTVTRSDAAAMGSQVITQSGSTEGTTFDFTPSGNANFTYSSHKYIKLVTDGNSTTTQPCYVCVKFRRL